MTRDLRVNHHNESQLSFDEQLKAQPLRGVSEGAPQVSSPPFSMDPSIYAILNVDAVRFINKSVAKAVEDSERKYVPYLDEL